MSSNLKSGRLILIALLVIAGIGITVVVTSKRKPDLSQVSAPEMNAEVNLAPDGRNINSGTDGNGALAKKDSGQSEELTVLRYLGNRASRLEDVLPPFPDNLSAWEKRRKQVQRELTSVLGLPIREPMRAKVLTSRTEDGVVVEDVYYLLAERCYVPAIVVRPLITAGRLPALVVPPGFGGSSKELVEYYKTFVYHMVYKGYIVIFYDDPLFGQRNAPKAGFYASSAASGFQGMGVQVFDALRALDYMLTRSDVDPGRIGIAGLCQGSEQTWLAAALDDRFQIAVPVCGTTTYADWANMPGLTGVNLSSADPYVNNVLKYTDWPEIAACIAPRPVYIASNSGDNWWPEAGHNKVVSTLETIYQLYGKPERFEHLRDLRSHSMTPYIPELAPWIDLHLKTLPGDLVATPEPCGEPAADADLNPQHYLQRQIVLKAEALPSGFSNRRDWDQYLHKTLDWLRKACILDEMHLGEVRSESSVNVDGMIMEKMTIDQDQGLTLSVLVYKKASAVAARHSAIVISHDDGQSATCPEVMGSVRAFVEDGYLVFVPEHASMESSSSRLVTSVVSLYGAGDVTGLSPIAMRVWDNLAALKVARSRSDVDKIGIIGLGVGGVDVAATAALDKDLTAVVAVNAITVRDWAEQVAPDKYKIMPYLPNIMKTTDWQYIYSMAAPRPLLLINDINREDWPAVGYERVKNMAEQVYKLHDASVKLQLLTTKASLYQRLVACFGVKWGGTNDAVVYKGHGYINEVRAWFRVNLPCSN